MCFVIRFLRRSCFLWGSDSKHSGVFSNDEHKKNGSYGGRKKRAMSSFPFFLLFFFPWFIMFGPEFFYDCFLYLHITILQTM